MPSSILGVNLKYVAVSGLCQACYIHFGLGHVSQPGSRLSESVCPAVSHSLRLEHAGKAHFSKQERDAE